MRKRALAGQVILVFGLALGPLAPVAAAATPTTTSLTVSPSSVLPGGDSWFSYTVSPVPDGGNVSFKIRDAADVVVWSNNLAIEPDGSGEYVKHFPANETYVAGEYTVTVTFLGTANFDPSTSEPQPLSLAKNHGSMTLVVDFPGPNVPWKPFSLNTEVPAFAYGDTIEFWEVTEVDEHLGSALVDDDGHATFEITGGAGLGLHTYEARWDGGVYYYPITKSRDVQITRGTTTTSFAIEGAEVELNHSVRFSADVLATPHTGYDPTGQIEVRRADTGAVVATMAGPNDRMDWSPKKHGTFTFRAVYLGNARHKPSGSITQSITVVPDAVHAHDVGVSASTFHPVVDQYLDTVKIGGVRDERAGVLIRIKKPSGTLVRLLTIPEARNAYSFSWNGKNDAGTLVRPGTYQVVQTLTDSFDNKLTVTATVALTDKKIVWRTVTLTRDAAEYNARGKTGAGHITVHGDGSVSLRGANGNTPGWAGLGYQFQLPAATLYGTIKIGVLGESTMVPPGSYGAWNFERCPYVAGADWSYSCIDYLDTLAFEPTWQMKTISGAQFRHQRIVREVVATYHGVDLSQVRLTVNYGVLQ